MPNHHDTILTSTEEAVGLVRPPVFILLKQAEKKTMMLELVSIMNLMQMFNVLLWSWQNINGLQHVSYRSNFNGGH